jgi:hypothetical protein
MQPSLALLPPDYIATTINNMDSVQEEATDKERRCQMPTMTLLLLDVAEERSSVGTVTGLSAGALVVGAMVGTGVVVTFSAPGASVGETVGVTVGAVEFASQFTVSRVVGADDGMM